MNNTNRYIANLYLVLLNVRDTLEYTINREHRAEVFNARKGALEEGIKVGTAFRNFLDQNGDKGKEILEKMTVFINDIYGPESTVLVLSGDKVRVDNSQHIKIYDYVIGLTETLRDIIFNYLNYAKQHDETEEVMTKLIVTDEALYRSVLNKLVMIDLEKAFAEFNKVMQESKGKPTPQSNFIVQNEIAKYAGYVRFSRQHCHIIDNKTLDLLDESIELIEMTEGRRERRDGKSFQELFRNNLQKLDVYIGEAEKAWKEAYKPVLDEMMALAKEQIEKNKKVGEA
ncbi:MAG: hypothetical protein RBR85_00535 [Bacilli bacterium]|jgi:hypothetical protein|nr:hypothetical protein [Bacilli bacterium]